MAEYIRSGDERDIPFDRFTRVAIQVDWGNSVVDQIIDWMNQPDVIGQYTWHWQHIGYPYRYAQFLISDRDTAFALRMRWG